MLQDANGRVLDKWTLTTREEEQVILQQFLRFGETKSIAQEIILQDARENREKQSMQAPKTESEIKKFIERSNVGMQSFMRGYDPRHFVGRSLYSPGSIASAAHLLSPNSLKGFTTASATRDSPRDAPVALTTKTSSSNLTSSSPLSRLQTMQPFDYRRERLSPTVSPSTSEQSLPMTSSSGDSTSPQNLSIGASVSTHTSPMQETLTPTQPPRIVIAPKHDISQLLTPKQEPREGEAKFPALPAPTREPEPKRDTSSEGAINYSTKDIRYSPKEATSSSGFSPKDTTNTGGNNSGYKETSPSSQSLLYAEQKVKHLRKSTHPTKRPWTPTPGYGGTLISPSGKKRVLCTACNKTFCDKGALKIHYSAVHLKEMHKCSVDGCNMMFSSRRSRNRHSANPNPKLHMPQARRKLTEGLGMYDERSCPDALSLSPGASNLSLSPQNLQMTSLAPLALDGKSLMGRADHGGISPGLLSPEKRYYLDPRGVSPDSVLASPAKIPRLEIHEPDQVVSTLRDSGAGRSARKRKSLIPTRCAQTEEMYGMSDDNTNDGMCYADSESEMDEIGVRSPSSGSLSHDDIVLEADDRADLDSLPDSIHVDERMEMEEEERELELADSNNKLKDSSDADITKGTFQRIQESAISQMDSISKVNLQGACVDGCESGQEEPHVIPASEQGAKVQATTTPTSDTSTSKGSESQSEKKQPSKNGYSGGDTDELNGDLCSPSAADEEDRLLDQETDEFMQNGDDSGGENGHDLSSDGDIPLDKDNPRKCPSCSKVFQNHFTVKTHFQNVHLKLMHTCSVEGCNAAFPSKRSRDRHSANLNLHRKLLSTSSDDNSKVGAHSLINQNLRDEFLPRIYDTESFHMFTRHSAQYEPEKDGLTNSNSITAEDSPQRASTPSPKCNNSGVVNNNNDSFSDGENSGDDSPLPDPDGSVSCHICKQPFRDNLVLKEHFEKLHPKEMYHCTIQGCEKIFSTRKSRNRHSQNDNLHRHLSPSGTNGTAA